MLGLIQKSGYIKPESGGSHYAEYIATREGVELLEVPHPAHDGVLRHGFHHVRGDGAGGGDADEHVGPCQHVRQGAGHRMVEVEVEYTEHYIQVLRNLGREVPVLDHQLCHIIASGMFNAVFEVVVHDMPYDQAKQYIRQLREFYMAGWQKLMGE